MKIEHDAITDDEDKDMAIKYIVYWQIIYWYEHLMENSLKICLDK